jgi:hypothetical protein
MITYFVTPAHRYTMDTYLETWGAELRAMVQVRGYHELAGVRWLPGGTYIFSDLERLTPTLTLLAAEVWKQLEATGPNVRLLNHPERVLRRTELLKSLHASGRNQFNVHAVTNGRAQVRFPAFLRCANDHDGSRTDLLRDQAAVDANIHVALCYGHDPRELIVIEYCNTADDDGVHHKYAAFRVGDKIIPRHLVFSRKWMLKYPDLLDREKVARELEYLKTNPHEAELREIFDVAHIEYGRCDYAVVNGRIQVWEINTNPVVMMRPEEYQPVHVPAQEYFSPQIKAVFKEIDLAVDPKLQIPISFGSVVLDRVLAAANR